MEILKCLACCLIFAVVNVTGITTYQDCGSNTGTITSLIVTPCPHEPCALIQGSNVSVEVNFTPKVNSTHVKTVVHGLIANIPIPFYDIPSDSCQSGNIQCPLTRGSPVTYRGTLAVHKIYPLIRLVVKWELRDDNDNNLVCFLIGVHIAAPPVVG